MLLCKNFLKIEEIGRMFLLFLCYNINVYGGVSMYQALYRKYRPKTFDEVVGQSSIVTILKNSIVKKKFSHAYLFFGSRGTGKTSLSKIFAKAVNCLESSDGNPCGKCENCIETSEKECVDLLEIDAASNNGVDEIRELRNKINLVPAKLKYKVYIIDEVHMLSIGAFNALLKTLEEPPEHAIFILATTDPQKVPETIVSRCQCFSFQRISTEMLVERLQYVCEQEKIEIDSDVLWEIAESSDGGMRDSLGMLDKLSSYTDDFITVDIYTELNGLITKKDLQEFSACVFSNDFKEVLNKLSLFNNSGKNLIQIISQFMYYLRSMIVNYYTKRIPCDYDISSVEKLITLINEKMFDIKRSGNPKIYIEVLLLNFMSSIATDISEPSSREVPVDNSSSLVKKEYIVEKNVLEQNSHQLFSNNKNEVTETQIQSSQKFITKEPQNLTFSKESSLFILNLSEIIKVRINNAFAKADKQALTHDLKQLELLKDYTFDQQIGYLVCEILNSKFRVASNDIIVMSYEYDSIVQQNLEQLESLEEIYYKITKQSKKFAIVTDQDWEYLKSEYIKKLKNGESYKIENEPDKIFKKEESNDIISSDVTSVFGDIVEFD